MVKRFRTWLVCLAAICTVLIPLGLTKYSGHIKWQYCATRLDVFLVYFFWARISLCYQAGNKGAILSCLCLLSTKIMFYRASDSTLSMTITVLSSSLLPCGMTVTPLTLTLKFLSSASWFFCVYSLIFQCAPLIVFLKPELDEVFQLNLTISVSSVSITLYFETNESIKN